MATTLLTETPRACLCGLIRVDLDAVNYSIDSLPKRWREYADLDPDTKILFVETECAQTLASNKSTFAPGHDARYKSLMQVAIRCEAEVFYHPDGSHYHPIDFATTHTPNLLEAIVNQPTTPAKKAVPQSDPRPARARVGRWEYDGQIVLVGPGPDATEQFHYTTAEGLKKVTTVFNLITTPEGNPTND